ncbi:ExeA family protein [Marinobacterium arenosum]|uniref:ExeA family protein n=1 Tax=Marinobacterium arenosum TaxID=2862496 RepID=UPI001C94BEC6|nr:AAA family ATPase [Marinobacterium arenosum]MBY4678273.1 AAA family ATPase [Marinobacterium arenosum]
MYSNYFGLSEPPFAIAPDPRYLYLSDQHREALAHLLYGIDSNGGFILLTGEVGTGKTTVCRCLLDQLPEHTNVAFILNPKYSVQELLEAICDELDIRAVGEKDSIKGYIDALNRYLLAAHTRGEKTVLIIDEAQNLSVDVLEQIRLLTNLETDSHKLLQIILIGQPELLDKLSRPELRQLNQRITARFHLDALSKEELHAYIQHRLSVAGMEGELFTAATREKLYKLSGGVPRLVNVLCDRALLGAYVKRDTCVDLKTLKKAAEEVMGQPGGTAKPRDYRPVLLLCLLLVAIGWLFTPQFRELIGPQPAALPDDNASGNTIVTAPEAAEPTGEPAGSPGVANATTAVIPPQTTQITQTAPQGEQLDQSVVDEDLSGRFSNPATWQWEQGTDLSLTQVMAFQSLFNRWGLQYDPVSQPVLCTFARQHGLGCLAQNTTFDEFIKLNRPAVMKLFNAQGQEFYATLLEIDGEVAKVSVANELREVRLEELKLWQVNQYLLLWKPPPGYRAPLQPGTTDDMVIWLDRQLAVLQGRDPRSWRRRTYDNALVRQVKRFQSSNNLMIDGVFGPRTAILLNSQTDNTVPRLDGMPRG